MSEALDIDNSEMEAMSSKLGIHLRTAARRLHERVGKTLRLVRLGAYRERAPFKTTQYRKARNTLNTNFRPAFTEKTSESKIRRLKNMATPGSRSSVNNLAKGLHAAVPNLACWFLPRSCALKDRQALR